MKKLFLVAYVLPSGTKLYHCDSFCTASPDGDLAKVYEFEDDQSLEEKLSDQIDRIHKNFSGTWNDLEFGPDYSKSPLWEGCTLEQIQVVPEEVTIQQGVLVTTVARVL